MSVVASQPQAPSATLTDEQLEERMSRSTPYLREQVKKGSPQWEAWKLRPDLFDMEDSFQRRMVNAAEKVSPGLPWPVNGIAFDEATLVEGYALIRDRARDTYTFITPPADGKVRTLSCDGVLVRRELGTTGSWLRLAKALENYARVAVAEYEIGGAK